MKNVILTRHHVLKLIVFGSNEKRVYLCEECHKELEKYVTIMENIILREFRACYEGLSDTFINNGGIDEEALLRITLKGFRKVKTKNRLDLEKRICSNAVSLLEKKKINGQNKPLFSCPNLQNKV